MATPMTKPSHLTPSKFKKAQVVALNELIEEEVTLLIDKTVVTCFASFCPYEIEVGKNYDVELNLNLADYYHAQKVDSINIFAERIENGFSYILYGMLHNDTFQTFTLLSDEGVHYDHPDLNDSFIKLNVDRIDVAFSTKDE
ncbi:hypothetical protein ACLBW8_28305 [Pseudomonas sp. M5A4_2d]|uniref:hypothetical protein n=1 Tax=Pseudomonas TaxID=286 RepID=UPI0007DAE851|nr:MULTISPECIES: hypothetical protein [Pseudomonas]MBX7276339.1 hypothetical protein [Pseudomonas sp. ERGC3:01]QZC93452.1 hypothetical protein K2E96_21385 [Pseudomonas sp. ERGC3:05]UXV22113.1 hypothetical protein N4P55_12395 [Pseudomonas fluorescens]